MQVQTQTWCTSCLLYSKELLNIWNVLSGFFFLQEKWIKQTHNKSVFLIKILLCYFHHLFYSFHLQIEFPPFSQQIQDFRLKPCSYTTVHSRLTMYVSLIFYYHPWKIYPLFFTGGQWWCQDFLYSQYSSEKTILPSN